VYLHEIVKTCQYSWYAVNQAHCQGNVGLAINVDVFGFFAIKKLVDDRKLPKALNFRELSQRKLISIEYTSFYM
jgi:hypothetical protein